jgi:hypothetical protein
MPAVFSLHATPLKQKKLEWGTRLTAGERQVPRFASLSRDDKSFLEMTNLLRDHKSIAR